MEKVAKEIEAVVKAVPGTTSAFAERITGGFYLDIVPDRRALARYGLTVGEVQDVVAAALGGEMVTTTVEGEELAPRVFRVSEPDAVPVPQPGQPLVPVETPTTADARGVTNAGSLVSVIFCYRVQRAVTRPATIQNPSRYLRPVD